MSRSGGTFAALSVIAVSSWCACRGEKRDVVQAEVRTDSGTADVLQHASLPYLLGRRRVDLVDGRVLGLLASNIDVALNLPDGDRAVTYDRATRALRMWAVTTGALTWSQTSTADCRSLQLSQANEVLCVGANSIEAFAVPSGERTASRADLDPISTVTQLDDSYIVITGANVSPGDQMFGSAAVDRVAIFSARLGTVRQLDVARRNSVFPAGSGTDAGVCILAPEQNTAIGVARMFTCLDRYLHARWSRPLRFPDSAAILQATATHVVVGTDASTHDAMYLPARPVRSYVVRVHDGSDEERPSGVNDPIAGIVEGADNRIRLWFGMEMKLVWPMLESVDVSGRCRPFDIRPVQPVVRLTTGGVLVAGDKSVVAFLDSGLGALKVDWTYEHDRRTPENVELRADRWILGWARDEGLVLDAHSGTRIAAFGGVIQ